MFGCFRLAPYHVIADRVRRGAPHHCLDDSLREYGPALSEPTYVPVDLGLSGMSWPAFADMFHTPPQTGLELGGVRCECAAGAASRWGLATTIAVV